MNREEILALEDNAEIAALLNKEIDGGKTADEALEAFGLTKADITKLQIFAVRGKYIARAWAGYTSTKRTGNEMGDDEKGVGGSDPSLGYNGV